MRRMFRLVWLFVLPALAMPALTRAGDVALMKACPGLAAWAKTHPRHSQEPSAENDVADAAVGDPALSKQLAARYVADQQARDALSATGMRDEAKMKAMLAVDADNLPWLRALIARQGFPTSAQVGKRGVEHAWMLVQHADRDPALQSKVLVQLMPRLKSGDIAKSDVALLTDRVLVAQGKSQRYGSQFVQDSHGQFVPKPIEDTGHLDLHRAQMDLMPLVDYRCLLQFENTPHAAR